MLEKRESKFFASDADAMLASFVVANAFGRVGKRNLQTQLDHLPERRHGAKLVLCSGKRAGRTGGVRSIARDACRRTAERIGPGMERGNLEEIAHAGHRLFADQRRKRAVNQYDCNSLRQMAVALLEGLPHGQFHPNLQTFQRSF